MKTEGSLNSNQSISHLSPLQRDAIDQAKVPVKKFVELENKDFEQK